MSQSDPTREPMTVPALTGPYLTSHYDAFQAKDLLVDEIRELQLSGYDVDAIVAAANSLDPQDANAQLALLDHIDGSTLERRSWLYEEPTELDKILETISADEAFSAPVDNAIVSDAVSAAWYGRIAGCNLGKPVENGTYWTVARIRQYLELRGSYPLADYFPAPDATSGDFRLLDNWRETARGHIHGSARDDDIDYTILGLHMLEREGPALTPARVGDYWTRFLPIEKTYTAERAAYRNVVRGFAPPDTARVRNPYREWIGAQIRGDIFGYVFPAQPRRAAIAAYNDAALSHVGNGIYGEMWVAALVAGAFATTSAHEALEIALRYVPPRSRFAEEQRYILGLWRSGIAWEDAVFDAHERYDAYPWVHVLPNAALVAIALLWADSDWAAATGKAVMGGWDTDSNGATVGSVAGVLWGCESVPRRFTEPLENRTRSALFGFDNSSISELAARTLRLGHQLSDHAWP